MTFKALMVLVAFFVGTTFARPQGGILTQQVRLPQLDSAHIAVQRVGGNFAYSVADSGPVYGLTHYAALPTVQYVPLAPTIGLAAIPQPQQQLQVPTFTG